MTNEEMIGSEFGRWTVLDVIPNYKNGKTYCKCKCSCDKQTIKFVYKNSLLKGESQSCGCLSKELISERCRSNVVGDRFGNLVVKKMLYNYKNKKTYCMCDCDCGKEHICSLSNLSTGHTTSCGCNHEKRWDGKRTDLVNRRFGMLVVDEMLYGYANKQTYCKCTCDCGNTSIVYMGNLLQGFTHSCGCGEHDSVGEKLIQSILDDNHITYTYNYRFNNCRNISPLPFDFYLHDYNVCIEYDGIQHFKPIEYFGGEEAFQKRQLNDKIKTEYCIDNHITLIRLPYTLSEDEIKNIVLNIWNP